MSNIFNLEGLLSDWQKNTLSPVQMLNLHAMLTSPLPQPHLQLKQLLGLEKKTL
jgi:hypothetical protein